MNRSDPGVAADEAREVFGRALDIKPERRAEFVRVSCRGDEALRCEVESLLRCDAKADELGRSIRVDSVLPRRSRVGAHAESSSPAWTIPGFTILGRIGEGGMGVVYEARQHAPRRRVAIKVLRDDVSSDRTLRRFEFEGQVLAKLTHPGIAKVYETGTLEADGARRPYLAMELVDGVPITEFVARRELTIRDRVRLMIRVCEAIQHAHQKGVLHRDLKPGNLLVDDSGAPRIVDFGTARVDDDAADSRSWHTATAEILGTIRYMSPEQLEGRSSDVDARSDIYALGVVLYEILTGRLPHTSLRSAFHQLARSICEDDPAPIGRFNRTLRGDLESIVQMALEKRPERRYASAAALADDLGRMLSNDLVHARPLTSAYRLGKFVRRHRPLVVAVATIFFVLAGAAVVSFDQWRRAASARDEAVMALDFFDSIFEALGESPGGRDSLVLDYLEMASTRVDERFGERPGMRARLHESFGKAYEHLGAYEQAAIQLAEALRLRRQRYGVRDAGAIELQTTLGGVYHLAGECERAEELLVDAVRLARESVGLRDPVSSLVDANWAWFLARTERYDEAEAPAMRAVEKRRDLYGERHRKTLFSTANLAALRLRQERFEEAAAIYETTLPFQEEILGPTHRDTLTTRANLTVIQHHLGNAERAVELQEELVEHFESSFGSDHPKTLSMKENLGVMYARADRAEDAIRTWRGVVEIYAAQSPPNVRLAKVLEPLAEQFAAIDRHEEARTTLEWVARITDASPRVPARSASDRP